MNFIKINVINSILEGQTSYEDLKIQINEALEGVCPADGAGMMDYHVVDTYPDSVVVKQYGSDVYYKIPYTVNLNGEIELGEPVGLKNVYQPIVNSMMKREPIIRINNSINEGENPVYRMLIQTPNELPAYDMGLNKIKFNEAAIQSGLNGLLGEFVYDETQSNHNKMINPNAKGKKVAKIVNKGYCPKYGGYADVEVFDSDFDNTMQQALDSYKRGLPVNEGPSTELYATDGQIYGDNNLEVTKLDYNGLVWIDNPRDKGLGVCSLVNNSILNIKEDDGMGENKGMVQIAKDEYDKLKEKAGKYDPLKAAYDKGEALYNKGKKLYDDLKVEETDLRGQLMPIWQANEAKKAQLVNSLLERVPEAHKSEKKALYEGFDVLALGEIVNSLPAPAGGSSRPAGVRDGAGGNPQGSNNPPEKVFEDAEKQAKWEQYQSLQSNPAKRPTLFGNPVKDEGNEGE